MGQERRVHLRGRKVYGCRNCRTHLAAVESLMSKKFNGQHGQAFLFHTCLNVTCGAPEDRSMTTGLHTVRDLRCVRCNAYLGWKYDKAYEPSQKYKENHYILERKLLVDVTPQSPTGSPPDKAGTTGSSTNGSGAQQPGASSSPTAAAAAAANNGHSRNSSFSTASMSADDDDDDDDDD